MKDITIDIILSIDALIQILILIMENTQILQPLMLNFVDNFKYFNGNANDIDNLVKSQITKYMSDTYGGSYIKDKLKKQHLL